MDKVKLFDSELKVMEVIWEYEPVTAKEISKVIGTSIGWNKNTTYTIIKKLIEKKYVLRSEPNFVCTSLIKKADIQSAETNSLIERLYNGSKSMFFASFLKNENLTAKELEELKKLIDEKDSLQ